MTEYRKIAALGSSYAAGPGISPVVNRPAMRSGRNYAHVVAARAKAELVDLTVSGATTATILDTPQRVLFTTFAPQITLLPADADLVTITAAGNDLHYLGSAIRLATYFTVDRLLGGRLRRRRPAPLPRATPQELAAATEGLTRIATQAAQRAPHARIVLVGYLPMVGAATTALRDVPFDGATIQALTTLHDELTQVFADAAQRAQVDLIQSSTLGAGHELGTAEPWIYPLQPPHRFPRSFHPTAAGMQAVGDAISRHIGL